MANINNNKVLNFSSKREQHQTCLNVAEREKNQGTKVLNRPPLRFPEFSGEWQKTTLGKNGYTYNGLSGKSATDFGKGFPYITYKSIFDNSAVDMKRVELVEVKLSEKQNEVKQGDIFFTTSSETPEEVGMSSVLLDNPGFCFLNSFCFGYRLNDTKLVLPEFMRFYLRSSLIRTRLRILAQGSTRFNISKGEVMKMRVSLPNPNEQAKIASFLSLIDDRISVQIGLIEDLKTLKSAISHKLFERKPINRKRLDTFFSKGKAGGTPRSTVKTYYDGNIPFLSINDMSLQGKYVDSTEKMISDAGLKNSSAWIVPPFSLIMSMYASVGLVAINTKEMATSQAMFAMVLTDKSLLDYLYYYLCYFKDRCIYKLLETGTQSNINADVVRGIMIPDYGEKQNQFAATVLNVIDEKISNESMVLEKMYQQKQYLLQMMFI